MSLDIKIKQATLETALRHLLRNKQKSIERTARNIIELGYNLSNKTVMYENKSKLYNELLILLENSSQETIKNWLIQKFHLFS